MFGQTEDSVETGNEYNLNGYNLICLINQAGCSPLLLHRWVCLPFTRGVKEFWVKLHSPAGNWKCQEWSTNLGSDVLKVRPENLAWELSQNRLLSWRRWRNKYWCREEGPPRQSDLMSMPRALQSTLWEGGELEMAPEAEVHKEYVEIGIYSIICVHEKYLLIILYLHNTLWEDSVSLLSSSSQCLWVNIKKYRKWVSCPVCCGKGGGTKMQPSFLPHLCALSRAPRCLGKHCTIISILDIQGYW